MGASHPADDSRERAAPGEASRKFQHFENEAPPRDDPRGGAPPGPTCRRGPIVRSPPPRSAQWTRMLTLWLHAPVTLATVTLTRKPYVVIRVRPGMSASAYGVEGAPFHVLPPSALHCQANVTRLPASAAPTRTLRLASRCTLPGTEVSVAVSTALLPAAVDLATTIPAALMRAAAASWLKELANPWM